MLTMNIERIKNHTYENVLGISKRLGVEKTKTSTRFHDADQTTTGHGNVQTDWPAKQSVYVNVPLQKMTSNNIGTMQQNANKSASMSNEALVDIEEMLSICTEYDKQHNSDSCTKISPALHITQNRIKTNGSLPRDRKLNVKSNDCNVDLLSAISPVPNHSESDVTRSIGQIAEATPKHQKSDLNYHNLHQNEPTHKYVPQSPRTKIRTCVTPNKTHESDEYDSLIHEFEKKLKQEIKTLKENSTIKNCSATKCNQTEDRSSILNDLSKRRTIALEDVRILKRKISELQCEEDEIFRDLDLEEALLNAELTTENIAIRNLEQDLGKVQNQIYRLEAQRNASRVMQETQQAKLKQTISLKQNQIESFQQIVKEDETIQEELERLSESLDNDKKLFEDLEFQYLEEESEWLSKREELLMRLKLIKKRIIKMKSHTNGLQQQTFYYQQVACDDTKDLEQDLLSLIQELEQKREFLKEIDRQIVSLRSTNGKVGHVEEANYDIGNLSESLIVWDTSIPRSTPISDFMSRSLNENMLFSNIESSLEYNNEEKPENYCAVDSPPKSCQKGEQKRIYTWDEIPTRDRSPTYGHIIESIPNGDVQKGKRWSSPDMLHDDDTAEKEHHNNVLRQSRIPVYQSSNNILRTAQRQPCTHLETDRSSLVSESDSIDQLISYVHRKTARHQRPLTRYLPTTSFNFDLRYHIESAGHQIALCPYVFVDKSTCKGYLHKLGATFKGWSKRWFVLNRIQQAFVYYADKSEKRTRGGAYFSAIEEVYLDHLNASKSDRPNCTFVVKTKKRMYQLQAASGAAARIWIDAIITGALGNDDFGLIKQMS